MKSTSQALAIPEDSESRKSLPEVLHQRVRLDILNGVFKRGQVLRQEELARRFKVSRVPLREAMSRLEAEGLIVLRPRRGYAVMSLDEAAIIEIFDLRAVLEEHAGHVAAIARTREDIDAVSTLLQRMEKLDLHAPGQFSEWFRCNREFHARIIRSSRRNRVAHLARSLLDAVEPYIRAAAENRIKGHARDAHSEHREIFNAFQAGDARGLAQLCRRHVESSAQRVLKRMRATKTGDRKTADS